VTEECLGDGRSGRPVTRAQCADDAVPSRFFTRYHHAVSGCGEVPQEWRRGATLLTEPGAGRRPDALHLSRQAVRQVPQVQSFQERHGVCWSVSVCDPRRPHRLFSVRDPRRTHLVVAALLQRHHLARRGVVVGERSDQPIGFPHAARRECGMGSINAVVELASACCLGGSRFLSFLLATTFFEQPLESRLVRHGLDVVVPFCKEPRRVELGLRSGHRDGASGRARLLGEPGCRQEFGVLPYPSRPLEGFLDVPSLLKQGVVGVELLHCHGSGVPVTLHDTL